MGSESPRAHGFLNLHFWLQDAFAAVILGREVDPVSGLPVDRYLDSFAVVPNGPPDHLGETYVERT